MQTGPLKNGNLPAKGFRCCYRDFLYTPRHAELMHLRRKETLLLSARFAALFVLVFMLAGSFWDGSFGADTWFSRTSMMRLLVAGVAFAVVVNRAVSARWSRRMPYLAMVMLIIMASLLCGVGSHDVLASGQMQTTNAVLVLGLVVMLAIMPVTLAEAGLLASPIVGLLLVGGQTGLATGAVPLEMLLAVLLPLALLSALVQLYRTVSAAHEIAIDPLTGCYTRAFGMEMIRVSFDGAVRKNAPYTVAFIDLDDFKKINDRYGHDYGDRILGEVGGNLVQRFRRSDLVVRWGGEEFLILLPELDSVKATEVLERVMTPGLAQLEDGRVQKASVGLSERIEDAISLPQNLIDLADQRMYEAKKRRDHDDMIAKGYGGGPKFTHTHGTPSAAKTCAGAGQSIN